MNLTVKRLQAIYKLLVDPHAPPQPPGTGRVSLSNGRELIGTWNWHVELGIAHMIDTGGIAWIIDIDEVVAFSPVSSTPGLTLPSTVSGGGDAQDT